APGAGGEAAYLELLPKNGNASAEDLGPINLVAEVEHECSLVLKEGVRGLGQPMPENRGSVHPLGKDRGRQESIGRGEFAGVIAEGWEVLNNREPSRGVGGYRGRGHRAMLSDSLANDLQFLRGQGESGFSGCYHHVASSCYGPRLEGEASHPRRY